NTDALAGLRRIPTLTSVRRTPMELSMTIAHPAETTHCERHATVRHYLMCRPEYFTVSYAINPWMDPVKGADTAKAIEQWERLGEAGEGVGPKVGRSEPVEGLAVVVFAANGALVVDGRVYGARFRCPEGGAGAGAYLRWCAERGYEVMEPTATNEGE